MGRGDSFWAPSTCTSLIEQQVRKYQDTPTESSKGLGIGSVEIHQRGLRAACRHNPFLPQTPLNVSQRFLAYFPHFIRITPSPPPSTLTASELRDWCPVGLSACCGQHTNGFSISCKAISNYATQRHSPQLPLSPPRPIQTSKNMQNQWPVRPKCATPAPNAAMPRHAPPPPPAQWWLPGVRPACYFVQLSAL